MNALFEDQVLELFGDNAAVYEVEGEGKRVPYKRAYLNAQLPVQFLQAVKIIHQQWFQIN